MKISDIMTRNVRVVSPDKTIQEAARLMDEMNVGVLPVCDGRRLRGMITDRDITVRATAAGLPPDTTRVRDVMSDNVWWCFDDDDVGHIVQLMSDHQIRRLPVVDHDKHLVGIVALGDLATDSEGDASRALRRISTPSEPDRTGTPTSARADQTRSGGQARLSGDERRELERRLGQEGDDWRHRPHDYREGGSRGQADQARGGRDQFRFREEDDVRAAFGSFGYPGQEGARNARMQGGFGGDGYQSYGDEYAGPGSAGRGYRPKRYGASTITGERARPGDDSSEDDRRMQDRERTWSLVNERRDHSNYGMGPGNTRFGNDATASRGEVRREDHRGRGPRNYQRSDDRIREDVSERLGDDVRVDASEIEVTVQNREVTLTGTVRDRNEKRWAEDIAESVSGVTHVQNNLRVGQRQGEHATGTEAGDAVAMSGNPGSGTAGTTTGTAPGGRASGRQRQTT
ncbi:CBS domain-containing protein [Microvirga pakistanensis]|uniref:CBS domain-containing protein n=1 Tax=Microvirga pakistanensis TaxID=1682650 RepID=UPI001FCECA87|nr:CBS domain-containing protein [Microvirga pakistanensis]